MIGRIRIISILKVYHRQLPTIGDFWDKGVYEICLMALMISNFYDNCEHEICCSGTLGILHSIFA